MKSRRSCSENHSSWSFSGSRRSPCLFQVWQLWKNLEMGAFLKTNREEIKPTWRRSFLVSRAWKSVKPRCRNSLWWRTADASDGRALMSTPKLLLLDEPSMGLAPIFIQEIFDIIQDIQKQGQQFSLLSKMPIKHFLLQIVATYLRLVKLFFPNRSRTPRLRRSPQSISRWLKRSSGPF